MTGNYMYDVTKKEKFLIGTNPEQFHSHWWDGGDPLWITAVRQVSKLNYNSYSFGFQDNFLQFFTERDK